MDNITILNSIRANADASYTERIPVAVIENIDKIGNSLINNKGLRNQFIEALVNKIGLTMVSGFDATNELAVFVGPMLEYGDTIEDIFVEAQTGQVFDPKNENPFGQKKPSIKVEYHKQDRQMQYKATISKQQLKSAFNKASGLADLITQITSSMYSSKEHDDFVMTKELIVNNFKNAAAASKVDVPMIKDKPGENAKAILKEIKRYISNIKFVTNKYNNQKVLTKTPLESMCLLIHKDIKLEIDTEYLAGLFNMDKADIGSRIIEVDNFNNNTEIGAVLLDMRGIRINPTLYESDTIYNPEGKYYNIFLDAWAIYSMAKYRNIIYFTIKEQTS